MADYQQVEIVQGLEENSPAEHDAAMAAKAEGAEETPERPEWLPEKFNSAEDMASAYQELEQKMAQPSPPKSEPAPTTEGDVPELSEDSLEKYSQEYYTNGSLSNESYDELEKTYNIPRGIAEAYIAGQQAIAETQTNEVYSVVGGQEAYQEMMTWANESLTEDEVSAFDNLVNSGDMGSILMAVRGLHARYTQVNGTGGTYVMGNTTTSAGGFQSVAELTEAMKDPKYRSDHAYRQQVQDRLAVSNIY